MKFIYSPLTARVIFEPGALNHVANEMASIGSRALILSTLEQRAGAEDVARRLGEVAVGVFDRAAMHVPTEAVVAAESAARSSHADCTVAFGGGSTIGMAKALALRLGLPFMAIPTTYAGSEMTPIWGMTDAGLKRTGRDTKVLARVVLYDPELTVSLPFGMSVTSGMNAIAHCVEALYAPDANPITSLMAEEAIRAIATALPRLAIDSTDIAARSTALYGAWLGGSVLGSVGMALHHKLCHTLGGAFNLPHSETHTAVLPHSAAYNAPAAPEAMKRVARALGCEDAPLGLYELARGLGAEMSLGRLGLSSESVRPAAELALQNAYANPRPLTLAGIEQLIARAHAGSNPSGGGL